MSLTAEKVGWVNWTGQAEDGYPTYSTPVYRCPGCGALFGVDVDHYPDQPGNRWPSDPRPLKAPCCGADVGSYDSEHETVHFDNAATIERLGLKTPAAAGSLEPPGGRPSRA